MAQGNEREIDFCSRNWFLNRGQRPQGQSGTSMTQPISCASYKPRILDRTGKAGTIKLLTNKPLSFASRKNKLNFQGRRKPVRNPQDCIHVLNVSDPIIFCFTNSFEGRSHPSLRRGKHNPLSCISGPGPHAAFGGLVAY